MDLSGADLEHRCREEVDRLCARYRWRLLEREEFVERTLAAAQATSPNVNTSYVALGVYNQALYIACTGDEGPIRWNMAYEELYLMLSERARRMYPELWEDAVQKALVDICDRLGRCVEPRAFFEFGWGYVRNAVKTLAPDVYRKGHVQPPISLDRAIGDADDTSLGNTLTDPQVDLEALVIVGEQHAELRALFAQVEREYPAAKNQLAAVRLKFLEGMDDAAISNQLGVPVKRIYELRSLGLKKLRNDERFHRLWQDENVQE
jgi:DNA-directed RNA polymerase specialized sigma24 family protein